MSLEVEDSIFFSHYREMVDSDFEVYSKKDTQIYKYRETRGWNVSNSIKLLNPRHYSLHKFQVELSLLG